MFEVRVADNFHYMDQSETYSKGQYPTWSEAVSVAREIVDRCLAEYHRDDMTADDLFHQYVTFGDDPFVIPVPDGEHFSGWDYAKQRCQAICG
jgi:hypothetical protein